VFYPFFVSKPAYILVETFKMRQLLLFYLLFILAPAQAQFFKIETPESRPWTGTDSIKGVRVFQHIDYIDTAGRRYTIDSSFTEIFSAGSIVLHVLSYSYSSHIENIELVSEERYHYFIYAKDSAYGYDWDGHREPAIRRLRVDSMLNNKDQVTGVTPVDQLFETNNAALLTSQINADSGTAAETFTLVPKTDPSGSMTCTVNYLKRPQLIATSLSQSPACRQGFSIHDTQVISECYPCKFDIRYSLEPIPLVKPSIASIFETYLKNETANMVYMRPGYTTFGSRQ
jgi:hypothetical protein